MPEIRYQGCTALDEAQREAINAPLRLYNRAHNPVFYRQRDLPENAARPLFVLAYDDAGTQVGGLAGETQFAWLKISVMAVAQPHRRRGIGRRLVELAEAEARSRGCRYAYVDTLDYQALDFYRGPGLSNRRHASRLGLARPREAAADQAAGVTPDLREPGSISWKPGRTSTPGNSARNFLMGKVNSPCQPTYSVFKLGSCRRLFRPASVTVVSGLVS